MEDRNFYDRFGDLTAGEALELNETARRTCEEDS